MIENSRPEAMIASTIGHKFFTMRSSIPASTCRASKVADSSDGKPRHLLTGHPITSFGGLRLEECRIEFVSIKLTPAHAPAT
jgi:hypothetical protein